MIIEEITGDAKPFTTKDNGQKLSLKVGDSITDGEYTRLLVSGNGKVTIRVDPNSTLERHGIGEIIDLTETVVVRATSEDIAKITNTPVQEVNFPTPATPLVERPSEPAQEA